MPDDRISVVMITRTRGGYILAALRHLVELPERPPIIVVDNGSTDGTVDAARSMGPRIEVRNALWTAWLRRPAASAWTATRQIVRSALRDRARRAGVRDALAGLPWVLSRRKPVPVEIDHRLQVAERPGWPTPNPCEDCSSIVRSFFEMDGVG